MGKSGNKGYFGKHAKSSAAMVSLGIHAILILVAVSFVAVRVYVKDEQTFEAKPVSRPQLKLKKLTVPVNVKKKKLKKPKLRKTIVSKPKTKSMDLKMPEITGIKGGTGYMDGGSLSSIGFSLDIDLFGGSKGSGNELEGSFFDLKMDSKGKPSDMEYVKLGSSEEEKVEEKRAENTKNGEYTEIVRNFVGSWNAKRLGNRYFKAPKSKFATTFMVPYMKAEEAPKAYGVENEVQPRRWIAYYNGKIAAPATGRFRFWGIADDVMVVRVKNRIVIDASLHSNYTEWDGDGSDVNDSYMDLKRMNDPKGKETRPITKNSGDVSTGYVVGDWFPMVKGKATDMEVLIGEMPGGYFFCRLLIEQEGVEYAKGKDGRPILPVFKTQEIPEKLVPLMKIHSGTATVEGPIFGVLK